MEGLNTEILYKGSTHHIQTQDKGIKAHYVESLIYRAGKLLSTRRTYYTAYLSHSNLKEKIKQLIKEQHKKILTEISEGKFDHF